MPVTKNKAGFFGKRSTTTTQVPMKTDEQLQAQTGLSNFVNQFIGNFEPGKEFTGDFTAPTTGLEKTGLSQLEKLLGASNTGENFDIAQQNLRKTAQGGFQQDFADIQNSPFITAMQRLAKQNLGDQVNSARARRGSRGTFFTTDALREERQLGERSLNNLNAIIGQEISGNFQKERDRSLNASRDLVNIDKFQNIDAPLSKIQASQSLGGLERVIEQGNLEARYQDFLRKQKEEGGVTGTAQSLFDTNVPFGIKSFTKDQPSIFRSILGEVSPIVGSLNTQEFGKDSASNQSSLSDAMKAILKVISAGQG